MQEHDSWQERYLSLVPEKLTAADVQLLLDLWHENAERLHWALEAFVVQSTVGEEDGADA
jgi:hypothetical protein